MLNYQIKRLTRHSRTKIIDWIFCIEMNITIPIYHAFVKIFYIISVRSKLKIWKYLFWSLLVLFGFNLLACQHIWYISQICSIVIQHVMWNIYFLSFVLTFRFLKLYLKIVNVVCESCTMKKAKSKLVYIFNVFQLEIFVLNQLFIYMAQKKTMTK
jgi:hypothetical protein